MRIVRTAFRSPNTLAFAEGFIQTLGQECLDYFIPVGQRHLNHLVSEMVAHYHDRASSSGAGQRLARAVPKSRRKKTIGPKTRSCANDNSSAEIGCKQRLGGLLRHYYRKAA